MLSMSMFGTSTATMFAQEVQKVAESLETNATVNTDSEEEILQDEQEQADTGTQMNVPTTFADAPADWAFTPYSRELELHIIRAYKDQGIDRNKDRYISITEANQYVGNISSY